MNDVPRQNSGAFAGAAAALAAGVAVDPPAVDPPAVDPPVLEPLVEPVEPPAVLCCACATAGRLSATIDATRTRPFIVPSSSAESRSPVSRVAPWVEARVCVIAPQRAEPNTVVQSKRRAKATLARTHSKLPAQTTLPVRFAPTITPRRQRANGVANRRCDHRALAASTAGAFCLPRSNPPPRCRYRCPPAPAPDLRTSN